MAHVWRKYLFVPYLLHWTRREAFWLIFLVLRFDGLWKDVGVEMGPHFSATNS